MDLGEKLFELRRTKNLTQEEVAEKLNVTRQTISKWETNQSTPDFDKILPLCELYEISPNELLKGEKQEVINSDENPIEEENLEEEACESTITKQSEDYANMTKNQIKQKSAEVVSSSILIFIFAVAFAGIGTTVLMINPVVVGCSFLVLVGVGVTRIVKHYMSIPKLDKTKEEAKQDKIIKQINDIIGAIGVAIYFIVSFTTMAWHITWVIFIIIGIVEQIVKLTFMLKEEDTNEE